MHLVLTKYIQQYKVNYKYLCSFIVKNNFIIKLLNDYPNADRVNSDDIRRKFGIDELSDLNFDIVSNKHRRGEDNPMTILRRDLLQENFKISQQSYR